MMVRKLTLSMLASGVAVLLSASVADADNIGARRHNTQPSNDLFYNHYVGPHPSGTGAQMYLSPQFVPANVGHTYTTYQPLMPHEMMHHHMRTHHVKHPGAGWTRTNVRYQSFGARLQAMSFGLYDDTYLSWWKNATFNTRVVKPWRL